MIKTLSMGNPLMAKLDVFMNHEIVQSIIGKGFPIRIQIPMNMSIRANITFKVCRQIDASSVPVNHFDIPAE
jgi:hypothetical protein